MSFETTNNVGKKEERKYHERNKSDDLQISRTDMNMLIMNYLVTGMVHKDNIIVICSDFEHGPLFLLNFDLYGQILTVSTTHIMDNLYFVMFV